MKLLMCDKCGDVFNLQRHLKSCGCGHTKGVYAPDGKHAEVNGNGISLAIGNGSLMWAAANIDYMKDDWRKEGVEGRWHLHPTALIAWARPHEGPANSHTSINRNL